MYITSDWLQQHSLWLHKDILDLSMGRHGMVMRMSTDFVTAWSRQILPNLYLAWLARIKGQPAHDKLWKGPKITFCHTYHIFYWFMVLTLHALPQSSQDVPLKLQRRVSVTSHQSRGMFFPLLDSMHVKCWVDISKKEIMINIIC